MHSLPKCSPPLRFSASGMVTGEPHAPVRHTWAEVHCTASRMAGSLAKAGVGPGDSVAILAGEPVDIAPLIQAVWMRGGSVTMLHQPTPRTDLAIWVQNTLTVLAMIGAHTVLVGAPFGPAAAVLIENGISVHAVEALSDGNPIEPYDSAAPSDETHPASWLRNSSARRLRQIHAAHMPRGACGASPTGPIEHAG